MDYLYVILVVVWSVACFVAGVLVGRKHPAAVETVVDQAKKL